MPDNMIDKIDWLGHGSFRVNASKVVYFDPWEVKDEPKADIIFVSHEHYDHCSPEDIEKISKGDTIIVTEPMAAKKLSGNLKVMKPGDSIEVSGISIKAIASYNADKQFHPRGNNWLGFLVELDGVKIYHSGDTDYIPEMDNLEVDIALLPVSGTYVMDASQAIEAARAMKPKIAVPMHYGKIVGTEDDARKFEEVLKNEMKVVIKERVE
ncbi:MBL fold metallo-hydrolase [Spirochaetota bacterium]